MMDEGLVARPPTPARTLDVVAMNENAGGRRVFDTCRPHPVEYKMPNGQTVLFHTAGCGESHRINVNYRTGEGGLGFADVCIVDDSCHLWPRFSAEAQGRPVELD